ncbi:MAG: hypothetical protein HGA36_01145 [Candidatus Moranbacteria bacterium]|nr:hypothetical protein [Candidatus Moranbacteria bacterium]
MDTNSQYQLSSGMPARANAGGVFGYDLQLEKQEIVKITNEVKNELLTKWKKSYANAQIFPATVAMMHPEALDFLLSFDLVSVYDNVARQAGLDANGRSVLPKIVWQIAQEKNWNLLDQILEAKLPLSRPMHVQVANLLKEKILNKVQMLCEKPVTKKIVEGEFVENKKIQLPLAEALAQYPKLAEQNVTSSQIKLRYAPVPARPSIRNWMTDFHDAMGSMKHSPIDRGNFLFHSENGKVLSASERQRLGTILKSLDEKTPLTIDPIMQVVVFENNSVEAEIKNQPVAPRIFAPEEKTASSNFFAGFQKAPEVTREAPMTARPAMPEHLAIADDAYDFGKIVAPAPAREARPDINLKQIPSAQSVFAENVLRSPFDSKKTEPIQKPLPVEKAQTFFSKPVLPANEKPFVAPKPAPIVAEKANTFFQIPQSKPPIGTEHYAAPEPPKVVSVEKKQEAPVEMKLPVEKMTTISPARNESPQSLDAMSDEALFKMIQEKKIKQTETPKQASHFGSVSFSSPQKIPMEKKIQHTQIFRAKPTEASSAKNQKNTVNLKG